MTLTQSFIAAIKNIKFHIDYSIVSDNDATGISQRFSDTHWKFYQN